MSTRARLRAARAAVSTSFFVSGFVFASWVAHIPAVQEKLDLSEGQIGVVLLGLAVGALICMPVAGWLISRAGSKKVVFVSALLCCANLPLPLTAPNLVVLTFSLVTFGGFAGALDVAMNAQGVSVEKRWDRPIMSSLHGLWSLGGLAGAGLAGIFLASGVTPLRHLTVVTVGMIFLVLITGGFQLSRQEEPSGQASDQVPIRSFWHRLSGLANKTLLALGALAFFVFMAEGAMADWSAVYLKDTLGTSAALAATGYAFFSLSMATCRFIGDWLTKLWGSVLLVRTGALIAMIGLVIATSVHHPATAILGFGLVGLGLANVVPLLFSAAGYVQGMNSGQAIATVTTTGYLGLLVGPPLIGFTAEVITLSGALGMVAGFLLIVAVFAPVASSRDAVFRSSVSAASSS